MPCECGALDVMCSMSESRGNLNESIKTFTPRSIEMGSVKRLLHLCSVHKSFASSAEAKRRIENSSSECLLENFPSSQYKKLCFEEFVCYLSFQESQDQLFEPQKWGEENILSSC